jgi:hypothetical protein
MEIQDFQQALGRLSGPDIVKLAACIDEHFRCAGDEVDWWQATIAIDRVVKAKGQWRAAALAASGAARLVLHAAEAAGIALPDANVTSVARSAGEVVRGLLAGPAAGAQTACLLQAWTPLFASLAAPAA